MIGGIRWVKNPLIVLSAAIFFIGERYFGNEDLQAYTRVIAFLSGMMAVMFSSILAFDAKKKGFISEAKGYYLGVAWKGAIIIGFGFYVLAKYLLEDRPSPETFLDKTLLFLWLSLPLLGAFTGLGTEWARKKSGTDAMTDWEKIRRSASSWFAVGLVLSSLICINYFGAAKDSVIDLSYLKVTQPSRGSLDMVTQLEKSMSIKIFYPHANEVAELVSEYFSGIEKSGGMISVVRVDRDLDPIIAKELKVSQNGQVVLSYGDRTERINIGLKLSRARNNLKKLDQLFQKSFTKLVAKEKIAYFTQSHGEMRLRAPQKDPARSLKGLEIILRSQNIRMKKFQGKNQLLAGVPEDASMVVIIGPSSAFIKEEVDAISKYLERGGALLVLFDDDHVEEDLLLTSEQRPLVAMLESFGLSYQAGRLANNRHHVTSTKTNVDKWFLYSNIFASHKAAETMSKNDQKIQVLFLKSGHINTSNLPGWKASPLVKTFNTTFVDLNRNYKMDENEKTGTYHFLAAAETVGPNTSSRVIVGADATAFSDLLLSNVGNQILLLDSFRYLAGDESRASSQISEEDVKIVHSRDKHLYVFYGSVFLVPSLVLLIGFLATRKRQNERKISNA